MVDPDKGTDLQFISAVTIDGKIIAKIEKGDVEVEIEYWNNAVLCLILGANSPFEVIQGNIKRIWAAYEIDKLILVRKGVFLVRFANVEDKLVVVKRGIYYVDAKPFLVKGWNPQMNLHIENIKSLPLWVQLPELDIRF